MHQPFRWNIAKREQLGQLLQCSSPSLSPLFIDDLQRVCARVIASSMNTDLVFVGRSPENLFDHLCGLFTGTSWEKRLSMLNISLRWHTAKGIADPVRRSQMRALLSEVGLEPKCLLKRQRGISFVDFVACGTTFSRLMQFMLDWANEQTVDPRALRRKVRFIGITCQKHTSPKTWRWQQHATWLGEFSTSAVQNVSMPFWIWSELANHQSKVTPSNPLLNLSIHPTPVRDPQHLEALTRAWQLFELGCSGTGRASFVTQLVRTTGMQSAWFRDFVLELRQK
jgi:hypothetical protein